MSKRDPGARPFAHRLQERPSLTAEGVCLARALEHLKPEGSRVVDDPYAELFLSRANQLALRAWSGSFTARLFRRLGRGGTTYVPLRHRFIDECLVEAVASGAQQVVLLGAGYDARAYRLSDRLSGLPVYEVDLPAISRSKAEVVSRNAARFPKANVVRVEIDFESETLQETLPDAGFEVGGRTFFTWEGVPMYLTRAAVKATLDAVWQLCGSGSAIAFDMWHLVDDPGLAGTARRAAPTALSLIGEPVTFGIHPEEIDHFLGRRGFTVTDLAMATKLQKRFASGERAAVDDSLYLVLATRLESPRTAEA